MATLKHRLYEAKIAQKGNNTKVEKEVDLTYLLSQRDASLK